MRDESKAGLLSFAYIIVLYIGGSIADSNKLAGAIITISATLALVGILYASWLGDQKDRRLKRYTEHAGEQLEMACESEPKARAGE